MTTKRKVLGNKSQIDIELLLSCINMMMELSNRFNKIYEYFQNEPTFLKDEDSDEFDFIRESFNLLMAKYIEADDAYEKTEGLKFTQLIVEIYKICNEPLLELEQYLLKNSGTF